MEEHSQRAFEFKGFWLWRRGDTPNWHIYWCAPGTRRVRRKSAGTPDLEEAKRRLIEFVTERRRPPAKPAAKACLMTMLVDHVERVLARTDRRWPAEKTALLHWSEFLENEAIASVEDLTLDAQDRFVDWRLESLRAKGLAASTGTVKRDLDVMKAALRSAWKRGHLKSVPYIRSAPQPPPRDRTLSAEECRALLAACVDPHLRRFVLLSLHTLQRPAAILDLRVEQVDLAKNRINFLKSGRIQTTKRRPVVPITKALRPELEQAIEESNLGYVVEYGGRRVTTIRRSFMTAAKRAGLPDIYPYVLRHTGATLLAAAGVPLRQIAGMLGHSEQRTTEIYAKHRPEYLMHAVDTLDVLFRVTATSLD